MRDTLESYRNDIVREGDGDALKHDWVVIWSTEEGEVSAKGVDTKSDMEEMVKDRERSYRDGSGWYLDAIFYKSIRVGFEINVTVDVKISEPNGYCNFCNSMIHARMQGRVGHFCDHLNHGRIYKASKLSSAEEFTAPVKKPEWCPKQKGADR